MKLKVFIGWGGPTSRKVALALRDWLPRVIQLAEPWMSEEDLEKGTPWAGVLAKELKDTNAGIFCITKENLANPWLHFEAGAISKALEDTRIWTYLFRVQYADVKYPLAQFNHTIATKPQTWKLLRSINTGLKDVSVSGEILKDHFETYWPRLEKDLTKIETEPTGNEETKRDSSEMLEEILYNVRNLPRFGYAPSYRACTLTLEGVREVGRRLASWPTKDPEGLLRVIYEDLLPSLSEHLYGSPDISSEEKDE